MHRHGDSHAASGNYQDLSSSAFGHAPAGQLLLLLHRRRLPRGEIPLVVAHHSNSVPCVALMIGSALLGWFTFDYTTTLFLLIFLF